MSPCRAVQRERKGRGIVCSQIRDRSVELIKPQGALRQARELHGSLLAADKHLKTGKTITLPDNYAGIDIRVHRPESDPVKREDIPGLARDVATAFVTPGGRR